MGSTLDRFRLRTALRAGCTVKDKCTDCENKASLNYCQSLLHPIPAADIPVPTPEPKGTPVPPKRR
jgi:hypothetical protein